ncbi:MAG: FtsX-like permease family protein [Roseivirga sp.]|nr:FtsX-like permease family protein [Roseivirga sp.]
MLLNYFKIYLRGFRKNKLFAFINLLGLVLGFTTFLIIHEYVSFERQYDDFHNNPDELYRIASKRFSRGEVISESAAAVPPLRALMKASLPDIEAITRVYNDGNCIIGYEHPAGTRVFNEENAFFADETFFEIFGFPLIRGNAADVLNDTRELALSASTAEKYFGREDPIGKTLRVTGQAQTDYVVSGIFSDPPANSHFKPEILFSFRTYIEVIHPDWGVEQNWVWNDFYTYVRTHLDLETLSQQVNDLAHNTWQEQYTARDMDYQFYGQPIMDIHTKSDIEKEWEANTSDNLLDWFLYIAIAVLLIAWVNYFNLSLAKSVERAREVGVRKTFGASKLDINKQLQSEAFFTNMFAILLSILLFFSAQQPVQQWLGVYYPAELNPSLAIVILALLSGSLLASVYPGIFLSRLGLLELVQGRLKARPKGKWLIKGLITFQMLAIPILIGATYLIKQQTEMLISQDLGIDTEQVVSIKGPRNVVPGQSALTFDRLKTELEQMASVQKISSMSLLPGQPINWYSSFSLHGDSSASQYMNINIAEYEFEEALGIDLVAGRAFDKSFSDSLSLVINESAAKLWGLDPAAIVGRTFRWGYSPNIPYFDKQVIGVVKDYQQRANSRVDEPMIFSLARYTPSDFQEKFILVKLQGNYSTLATSINHIREQWSDYYPNDPFNYEFLDGAFARIFQSESQMLQLISVFGVLSIALAGLGLFGLSSLIITQRTKEVGIRKVLGASLFNVIRLLSRDFLRITLVAYILAVPLMLLLANNWLENYEIRTSLNALFFALPLLISISVVLMGTFFNSLSLARKNPVDSLRQE